MKKIYISLVILLLPVLCLAAQQSTDVDTAMYNVINSTHIVNGSILSEDIKDGTIANADLGANSVGGYNIIGSTIVTGDIKNETILSEDIYNGTIASADIADGTIANGDMAANSIGSYNLIDSTITTSDILNGTIKGEDMEGNTVGSTQLADGFTATSITSTWITANTYYGNGSKLSGISSTDNIAVVSFYVPGDAFITTGIAYCPEMPFACTITTITATVGKDGTAPTGSALIFDVNISTGYGANAYYTVLTNTTTGLDIPATGTRTGTSALAVTAVNKGDSFRLDIDAVGSTLPGGDPCLITIWGTRP